jgi:hypothetical protein
MCNLTPSSYHASVMRSIPLRRSKTPKRGSLPTSQDNPSGPVGKWEGFGTPLTERTTKLETSEDSGSTMGLEVPVPSATQKSSPRSQRARSLSRDSFWRRRKLEKELAANIYNRKELGLGIRTCTDIFRPKPEKKRDDLEVDYMSRQFSSDYSFVEVVLGEYKITRNCEPNLNSQRSASLSPNNRTTSHRESSQAYIPDGFPSRAKTISRRSTDFPIDKGSPLSISQAAGMAMASPPPISDIELKRRRSDLVSELSEPFAVRPETVASVQNALAKAQQRLAGARRRVKRLVLKCCCRL